MRTSGTPVDRSIAVDLLRRGAATSHVRADDGTAPTGTREAATGSGAGRYRTHDGYRHEAFFWEGDDQFLAGTVPFIREGLAAGQPVMVAVTPTRIDLLRETPEQVGALLTRYARVIAGLDDGRETWRQLRALNQLGVTRGQLARQKQ